MHLDQQYFMTDLHKSKIKCEGKDESGYLQEEFQPNKSDNCLVHHWRVQTTGSIEEFKQ